MGSQNIVKRIIRKPELLTKVGMSDSTVYRLEKLGRFPERIQLGPSSVGWIESEVDQWIDKRSSERLE